jgi:hypothetical protein
MTISGILQNRLSPVPDYYMPGRAEIELGTNVLKGGRTEAANGDPATKTPDVTAKKLSIRSRRNNFLRSSGCSEPVTASTDDR